tara:strand:+ start:795 stop:1379 length:585 start_codon:yes stop_codon:yes gene_type:complete
METFIQETMLDDVSICDQLIDYYDNNMEYKCRGSTALGQGKGKVSTDVPIYMGSQNPSIHMYVSELFKMVDTYLKKYGMHKMIRLMVKEPVNLQHYAPNEGFFEWHCERSVYQSHQRALVFMTYLNDVNDGGETEFHFQQLKVKAVKGKTIIWPTDFTHLHRGITSPTEHKYIATGWFHFLDAMDWGREFMNKK